MAKKKKEKCTCPLDHDKFEALQADFMALMEKHKEALEPPAFTHYMMILLARMAYVLDDSNQPAVHLMRIFSMALDFASLEFEEYNANTETT